jgi:hypothetical protein
MVLHVEAAVEKRLNRIDRERLASWVRGSGAGTRLVSNRGRGAGTARAQVDESTSGPDPGNQVVLKEVRPIRTSVSPAIPREEYDGR